MSPALVNLVEDHHEFISKEYYFHWNKAFWETKNKVMRNYKDIFALLKVPKKP